MNKYLIIFTLIFLLTACSPTPTVVPSAPTTNSNNPNLNPASPAAQEVIPTITSAPESSATLSLQSLSPQDEAVVNTSQVEVIGYAPAGAVVSVNDEIFLIGDDGQFKTMVSLEEGPNLIEIIASDANGNEISLLLTVTYEP